MTPWTVAHQASPSMGFSKQKYWSRLSFPTPGNLPHPRIKTASPVFLTLAGRFLTTVPPEKPKKLCTSDHTGKDFRDDLKALLWLFCPVFHFRCLHVHYNLRNISVQFSRSVVSDSLRSHESQHARPPCPSPTPRVHSDSHPSSQ